MYPRKGTNKKKTLQKGIKRKQKSALIKIYMYDIVAYWRKSKQWKLRAEKWGNKAVPFHAMNILAEWPALARSLWWFVRLIYMNISQHKCQMRNFDELLWAFFLCFASVFLFVIFLTWKQHTKNIIRKEKYQHQSPNGHNKWLYWLCDMSILLYAYT